MELHLTTEQTLLRDSAAKFIATAGPKVAHTMRGREPSFAPERLRRAGELGWLGMLVPSSADGLGLGLTELALVIEQAGRGLACEPIGFAAIAAAALAQGPAPHPMLQRLMRGDALVVPALQENAHGLDLIAPRTQAAPRERAPRLTGVKTSVCADGADGFLASANGPDGPALYYVAREAPGVSITATQTVEGRKLATLALNDAPADLVPPRQSSRGAVEALTDLALFALSAELLGVMVGAQELAFEYLRVRRQFDKPIGAFQALQHKAVDIYIKTETTRSLLYQIANANDPYRMEPALVAAIKAKASADALAVTQACIQLHGAIGFTDEHDIGLYLKRAMLLSSMLGNAAAQRRRYIEITGLGI
ncbi:MAG TPA: acyl-CoA dehydrogenase family protein [Xanthobacteraceae bacterium]|jgi:alkylation response protein AidB-like acyl-CoA dehydrogenase|nr:acyl-CoA dehydrogenase family protein [Xanthobacteraceae bacterium]